MAMQVKMDMSEGKAKIALNGRFDFSSHREFRNVSEDVLAAKDVKEIELDLKSVDYLDSSALGMLLLLREKANNANLTLSLTNCHGLVRQVLDVANFGRLFTIR